MKFNSSLLTNMLDNACLTTKLEPTRVDSIKVKLCDIIATMAAISSLDETAMYLTVDEDGVPVKYPLSAYLAYTEFSMFAEPRAIKVEANLEWANLKTESIFEVQGKILTPEEFMFEQSIVLSAFGKTPTTQISLSKLTETKPLSVAKTSYVKGNRIFVEKDNVKCLPVYINDVIFSEDYFPPTMSQTSFMSKFTDLFIQTFTTVRGMTRALENEEKKNFRSKRSNKSKPKNSAKGSQDKALNQANSGEVAKPREE